MLEIKTTGVEDYLDGSANIKALIIGGPGAGKTRMSSFWPKPIYLDCENSRGSLVDRRMPYAEIKTSKDMLDALSYLKSLERIPKAQRQYQTVVVDTVDSFQRIVKDEWLAQTGSGVFTGYDAWGYLDTKMNLLMTRVLNLDYNVITLVHYKEKDNEGSKEYGLQLQGAVAQSIFNDFGLIGWLGTYWDAGENGREQRRGLTFHPTPDKDFLKDRFNVTPKWMPITLTSEQDYDQIFEAFFNRPEFEALPEATVVGEIPDSEKEEATVAGPVAEPTEGGPLPARPAAEVPLAEKGKAELTEIARELGLKVKGNALKSEIVKQIEDKRAADAAGSSTPSSGAEGTATASTPAASATAYVATTTYARPASTPSNVVTTPTSRGEEPVDTQTGEVLTPQQVAEKLGGEVISEERVDAPSTPQAATPPATAAKPSAPQGPSACADCGADLSGEWADPAKKDYIRLSFVKFRKYLCEPCRENATK